MKLLEIILVLSIGFFLIFSFRFDLNFETELAKIETRNELVYSVVYARSRAILLREKINLFFFREDENLNKKDNRNILKLVSTADEEFSRINLYEIDPAVVIVDLSPGEKYSPFHFTATGNARNGTLEWKVGEEVERIVVNNRGRIRWER